jgi:hypothetical protein
LIVELVSEGARNAQATLQTFADEDQAASQSIASKLIVDFIPIKYSKMWCSSKKDHFKGAQAASITFTPFDETSKFIIALGSEGAQPARSILHDELCKLIVNFISIMNSEGARALSTTFPVLHNRTVELIVAYHYSKTFLHFSKSFTIFCEGELLPTTIKMRREITYLVNVVEMKANLTSS